MGISSVITDIAPLYASPVYDSLRLDEVLYGKIVQVIEEDPSGWCYIRTGHNTEGFTPTDCLDTRANIASGWSKYQKHIVLAPYIDVQQRASADSAVAASVPRGGQLVALAQPGLDGWRKVGMPDGSIGFTRASYLGEEIADWTLLAEEDMRWNIVESALSYNGTAWRTGGRSPQGIDDVGLAVMSYALNGVEIPREPFFKPGSALHSIETRDMHDGDVLYFSDGMGVYIGNDSFIYATETVGTEGVTIASLNPKDPTYQAALAGHIVAVASLY